MRLDHYSFYSQCTRIALRDVGRKKLPFAGYSVGRFGSPARRPTSSLTLSGTIRLRASRATARQAAVQAARRGVRDGSAKARTPGTASFPVVIGAGSHPFPFRTRKLSLLPPMVLRGKLCGRVGRCRHYSFKAAEFSGLFFCARQPPTVPRCRLFFCTRQSPPEHTVSRAAARAVSPLALRARATAAGACGRVGRCRDYLKAAVERWRLFFLYRQPPPEHTVTLVALLTGRPRALATAVGAVGE